MCGKLFLKKNFKFGTLRFVVQRLNYWTNGPNNNVHLYLQIFCLCALLLCVLGAAVAQDDAPDQIELKRPALVSPVPCGADDDCDPPTDDELRNIGDDSGDYVVNCQDGMDWDAYEKLSATNSGRKILKEIQGLNATAQGIELNVISAYVFRPVCPRYDYYRWFSRVITVQQSQYTCWTISPVRFARCRRDYCDMNYADEAFYSYYGRRNVCVRQYCKEYVIAFCRDSSTGSYSFRRIYIWKPCCCSCYRRYY